MCQQYLTEKFRKQYRGVDCWSTSLYNAIVYLLTFEEPKEVDFCACDSELNNERYDAMTPHELNGTYASEIEGRLRKVGVDLLIQVKTITSTMSAFGSEITQHYNEETFSKKNRGCFIVSFSLKKLHHSTLLYFDGADWKLFDPAHDVKSEIYQCINSLNKNDVLRNISCINNENGFSIYQSNVGQIVFEHIRIRNEPPKIRKE